MRTLAICINCGKEFSTGEKFCPFDGSLLHCQSDALATKTVENRYVISEPIHKGKKTSIYIARDNQGSESIIVRLLWKTELWQQFQAEAETIAQLKHANIVRLFGIGSEARLGAYMKLEYGTCGSVRELARKGVLPHALLRRIISQVCDALIFVHSRGLNWPTVKPGHICLRSLEPVDCFLIDALSTYSVHSNKEMSLGGSIVPDPHYAAPETIRGQARTPAANVYNLGCTIYELLTGRPPFDNNNHFMLANLHLSEPPKKLDASNLGVSQDLCNLVMACLEKDPNSRPNVVQVRQAFQ